MTDERKTEWARKALGTGIIIILLLPLFVAKGFLLPFNSGKVLIFRAVVDVLLAPTVWLILSAGWPKIVFHPLTLFWGLFLAVRIAAGAAGLDPFQSFWGELNRAEGLLTEIHVWLFLLVVITAFVSGFREEIALGVSVGGALLVFADALLLEKAKWVFLGVISKRSSGTIGNPAFLAVFLSFNSFFALYLAVKANRWIYKVLYGLAWAVLSTGVLFTQTRSAALPFLAILVVLVAVFCFIGLRRLASARHRLVFSAAGLVLLAAIIGFFPGVPSRLSRLTGLSLADGSLINRILVWKMDLEAVAARPIFGWGPENQLAAFYSHYDPAARRMFVEVYDRAHNMIIDTAASSGILGLVAAVTLHVSWSAMIIRRIRRAKGKEQAAAMILAGAYASFIISNQFLFEQITTWIPLVLLAAVTAAGHFGRDFSPSSNFSRAIPAAAGAVGAVFLLFFAVYPATALTYGAMARRYVETDPARSLGLYQRAYSLGTFANREMAKELAIELIKKSDAANEPDDKDLWMRGADLAEDVLRGEIDRHPWDVSLPTILAKLEDVRERADPSNPSQAVELLEKVHGAYPNLIDSRWNLALHRIKAGQIGLGIRLLEETAGMVHSNGVDPEFGDGYLYLGVGYFLAGRPADAEVSLRMAEKLKPGLVVEVEAARERFRRSKQKIMMDAVPVNSKRP